MSYCRAFRVLKVPVLSPRIPLPSSGCHSLCCQMINRGTPNLYQTDNCIIRHKHTGLVSKSIETGFFKKILQRVGWFDYSKSRIKMSGYVLYESVADGIRYDRFFNEFALSDTFFSWFLVTELHVWMLLVRTMNEGEEGRFARNCVVEAMWQDISTRAKKLGAANPSSVREQVQELSHQFQAALIGYDEGLLSDDRVLAGAVWRRFFQRNCDRPEHVERLVHYIRKQVLLLDQLPRDEILLKPNITWIDINDKSETQLKT